MASAEIMFQVFVIFVAAKLAGEVASRLNVPAVVGELLVGILIGPYALGLVGRPGPALIEAMHDPVLAEEALHGTLEVLSELGVIILLFVVGLETRLDDILKVGRRATGVAIGGVVLPLALGYFFGLLIGETTVTALFLGTALVATSVGITARVLGDMGQIQTAPARIILGAAVIDDILGMLILAVVAGLAGGDGLSSFSIAVLAVEAIGFTVFVVLVGNRVIRRFEVHLDRLRIRNAGFVVALGVCLGLAALANAIGLAAIIGAFLAGMVFAEASDHWELERHAETLYDVLVPFFFVVAGTNVDPALFLDGGIVTFATALTVLAIIGKLVGCGLGASGLDRRTVAVVGVGMVPRGEVGLVVAGIGRATGAISDTVFSVVAIMSIVTALIVPPVLVALLAKPLPPDSASLAGIATSLPGDDFAD